jgi:hypothetical protein
LGGGYFRRFVSAYHTARTKPVRIIAVKVNIVVLSVAGSFVRVGSLSRHP